MTWTRALTTAIRSNPNLAVMLGIQLGLMCVATRKAKKGRPAEVPSADAVVNAMPMIAASALLARRDRYR